MNRRWTILADIVGQFAGAGRGRDGQRDADVARRSPVHRTFGAQFGEQHVGRVVDALVAGAQHRRRLLHRRAEEPLFASVEDVDDVVNSCRRPHRHHRCCDVTPQPFRYFIIYLFIHLFPYFYLFIYCVT